MKKSYEMDMCNGPLLGKILVFTFPLMLSGVLQLLFNAADIVVVGRFSGAHALAAVGSTGALINLLINVFMGLSIGTNVLTAQGYGAKNAEDVSDTVHTSILLSLVSGTILIVVGILFSRPLLELMATPEEVLGQAALYMKIYFIGMPAMMAYNFGAAILRAIGDTRRPLYYLLISGVVNVILNLIFVIIFKMGVAGVATATVISQVISAGMVLKCLMGLDGMCRLDLHKLAIHKDKLLNIARIGLPAGMQGAIFSISNVLIQSSVNSFGSIAMAGYTAANNLLGFLYASVNSITQACMSFTSQNYGVGKWKRMDRVLIDCMILTTGVALVIGGAFYGFGPEILKIYTDNEEVVRSGMEILSFTTLTYFLCGLMDLFPGALRGMGHSAVPMILSVLGTVGTRVVWIFLIFPQHRSLDILFISYPASWLLTIVMQVICFWFVRKKVHESLKKSGAAA